MSGRECIIVGAGPAGLTGALELLDATDVRPVVFEATGEVGGISKTVAHKGNRIDTGGHRFFSRSDRVVAWWERILPLQGAPAIDDLLLGRAVPLSAAPGAPDPETTDRVMLVRERHSRIFHRGRFIRYPVTLDLSTFSSLGWLQAARIGASYLHARLFPIRVEKSLEDLFVNRFGRELYGTFFRDYTEKVWGVPCDRIDPAWGRERVRGLTVSKALSHAARAMVRGKSSASPDGTETSLIDRFLYPKLGPGQLWEEVARIVTERGGEIHLRQRVTGIRCDGNRVTGVTVEDLETGATLTRRADYLLSSMPVRDLVPALSPAAPANVRAVAEGLGYRSLVTVGVLLRRLKIRNTTAIRTLNGIVPDTWIYVQDRGVRMGRIQLFNNWSPYLVADRDTVWLGLEYFCDEGDALWSLPDTGMLGLSVDELCRIGVAERADVVDGVVLRTPKAYPAYTGTYGRFSLVREYLDAFGNLFLVGRNGMHRYNNMDHAVLTAMAAAGNIASGDPGKENVWSATADAGHPEGRAASVGRNR